MITWQQFKTKVPGKLHGPDLSKLQSVTEVAREASQIVLGNIDPYTTKRRARIDNAIYDKVYDYVAPSDLKGNNKVTDIKPISVERSTNDNNRYTSPAQFDIKKSLNTYTISAVAGVKTLRLSKYLDPRTVIHRCDSLTLEGDVTGSGDVENLTTNELEHVSGSKSIQFDLSGSSGTGTLEFALDNFIDLEDMEDLGALFHFLKLPDASDFTSIELRWGSDSSNYWSQTVTSPQDRDAWEANAWMLNSYTWVDATQTGSPDVTKVDYIAIIFTYSNAQQNVFVDSITAALGEAYEMEYYSNRMFRDTSGNWTEVPNNNSDEVMLEGMATNIFLYEFMKAAAQEIQGKNMTSDIAFFNEKLGDPDDMTGLYGRYIQQFPSEEIVEQQDYYDFADIGPHS